MLTAYVHLTWFGEQLTFKPKETVFALITEASVSTVSAVDTDSFIGSLRSTNIIAV